MRTGLFTPIQNKTTQAPDAPKKRAHRIENALNNRDEVRDRQQRFLGDLTNAEVLGRQQDELARLEALQNAPRKRPHAAVFNRANVEVQARLDFDDASADENAGDDHFVHRM